MIINVTYGNAESIGRYIQGAAKEHGRDIPGTEDRARIIEGQGFGFPIHTQDDVDLARAILRKDVELQASNTKPIENTAIHSSMSWPEGYQPTRDEMRQAVDGLAKAWGMEGARRITWSHNDTDHDHIHTWWGAANPDTGYAWHDHERNDRAQREAIRQEREYGPLPASRQRDHDIAAAAEASDHTRTWELSKGIDGSISRRRLDRALSLGGHFGPEKTAQRKEFINQNELTKFPRHRGQAYAPQDVAREKRDYIRENREASSNLARTYNREAKERERGVAGLYEDHSFEKTSQPPPREERKKGMGIKDFRINDALDWPWNKAGEIIRKKWREVRPDRNFGKEVQEKGWDDPGVRRQWEKQYGGEQQREKQQERINERWGHDRQWREAHGLSSEKREERRENPIRSAWDKLTGRDKIPPWEKEEQRWQDALRKHGLDKAWEKARENPHSRQQDYPGQPNHPEPGEAADQIAKRWKKEGTINQWERQQQERPPQQAQESSLSKWYKDQMSRPRPDRDQELPPRRDQEKSDRERAAPALPPPREVPMPKLNPDPRDQVYRPQQQEPKSMSKEDSNDRWRRQPSQTARDQEEQRGKEPSREQGGWLPTPQPTRDVRDTLHSSATGRHHDPDDYIRGKGQPHHPVPAPGREEGRADGPAGKQAAEDKRWHWRGPERPPIQIDKDHVRKSLSDKLDRADPPKPEQARGDLNAGYAGGSHEHGSSNSEFRRQLDESLRKIRLPEREIEKDRERER